MSEFIDFHEVAERLLKENPDSNLYLLLDHAGLPGLARELENAAATWRSLFDQGREEGAVAVAPRLVLVGSQAQRHLSRSFLNWLGEHGTYTSTVMLLNSPLELASLAMRLSSRLEVMLSESMDAMLRFFDPRVFESLLTVFTSQQRRDFLSAASLWSYTDRAGKIIHTKAIFCQADESNEKVLLTQAQEFSLLEASEVDQVLSLLDENVPRLMKKIPLPERFARISQRMEESRGNGLGSVLQMTLYALAVMLSIKEPMDEELHYRLIEKIAHLDMDNLWDFLAVNSDEFKEI